MPFIRHCSLISIFISLTFTTFSQDEMESSCIKTIKKFSDEINFPKYKGITTISKDTIKFDSSCIIFWNIKSDIINIFGRGIIFPDLIYGASTHGDKYEFKNTFSADTLIISDVMELNLPDKKPGTKWFSFLLHYKMMANPSLYLFELTNENANPSTSMKVFIENAKVTAFGFCSILI